MLGFGIALGMIADVMLNAPEAFIKTLSFITNKLLSFEENVSYAQGVSDFVKHIHVFNWKGDNRLPLADGIDFWKEYLQCFESDKTLLLEFMPDDKIETLKNESNALKLITK